MGSVNVTFSIPEELNALLHVTVKRRELSRFVAEAILYAIEHKQNALKSAYDAANKDPDREEVLNDWDSIENEGWNE